LAGSLSRSDWLANYNQLLRIEQLLGKKAVFAGLTASPNARLWSQWRTCGRRWYARLV